MSLNKLQINACSLIKKHGTVMKKNKSDYLSTEEIHSALLGILVEFDRICRKHDLTYSLAYGTLIGAIRHKGFIPWDDDIDVIMPRPDYEKFYEIVHSGELNEHFLISEDRGKKAFYPFCKLMDDRYSIKAWSHIEVPYLFIDIFPLDGAADNEKDVKKQFKKRLHYNGLAALSRWAVPEHKRYLILRFIGFPAYLVGTIYGRPRAAKNSNKHAVKYDYDSCTKCGSFAFGDMRWIMEKDKLFTVTEMPFEGRNFFCMTGYDEFLKMIYGNYMKLPPADRQVTHGLKVRRTEPLDKEKNK